MLKKNRLYRPEIGNALFAGDDKLNALVAPIPRVIPAGTTIVPQGSRHDYVYRLRSGWVARVRSLSDGRAQYLIVFLPGDLFGVKSMFVARQPDAVIALSDVTVDRIEQSRLQNAFAEDPQIALRCMWQVVEEERRLHNWVVSLGQGSAEERIAYMLLEFSARLAPDEGPDAREFTIPLTQEQLGSVLGLTSVHVNRVLRRLREDGIVSIRQRVVSILNTAELERIARPLQDASTENAPQVPETVL